MASNHPFKIHFAKPPPDPHDLSHSHSIPKPKTNTNKPTNSRSTLSVLKRTNSIQQKPSIPSSPHIPKPKPSKNHIPFSPFEASPSNLQWLEGCAVGTFLESTEFISLKQSLQEGNLPFTDIKLMGGNQALLSFQSPEEMTSALQSHQDLLSNYFSRIKPWSPQDVSRQRISWITCYGVPLHVWSSNFFSAFGNLLGRFLGVDEATAVKDSFDCARILVCTSERIPINQARRIAVGEDFFDIILFEDPVVDVDHLLQNSNICFDGFEAPDCNSADDVPSSGQDAQPPTTSPSPRPLDLPADVANSHGMSQNPSPNQTPLIQSPVPSREPTITGPNQAVSKSNSQGSYIPTPKYTSDKASVGANAPNPFSSVSCLPTISPSPLPTETLDVDDIPLSHLVNLNRLKKTAKRKKKSKMPALCPPSKNTPKIPKTKEQKSKSKPKAILPSYPVSVSLSDPDSRASFVKNKSPPSPSQAHLKSDSASQPIPSPKHPQTQSNCPSQTHEHFLQDLERTWEIGVLLNITEGISKEDFISKLSQNKTP
ncbi:hypothetical protein Tsubulata_023411 [Turnera subulata]|nr:hypothetical protein Tsubulata_023411 [Turnera subulata]